MWVKTHGKNVVNKTEFVEYRKNLKKSDNIYRVEKKNIVLLCSLKKCSEELNSLPHFL